MADNWMLGEAAALDDYIPTPPSNMLGNAAQGVKDWYTSQPSWLDRAKAENQKTLEAYGRGGMGEIAKQLTTDTTEPQDLYGAFGVGNIKGVRPPIAPSALAATSEYRPPFYSAVEQAVQGAKQNAAPGQQWAGFLRNQPGVKPEEVEALKLGKLFEQPGAVPKQAVLGEIAANRVNVGEVIKGEVPYVAPGNAPIPSWVQTPRPEGQTKFQQYTLPGGENYREMLLTLPKKPKDIGPAPELLTELPKGPDWDNSYRVIHYSGDGPQREWGVIPPGQSHARSMVGQHPTEAEAVRQALNHINAQNAQQYNQALHDANKGGTFTSSHFDEPNVLAHVRYNDRVIDGKKTLFVEEVQSDWHQQGKRKGYKTENQDQLNKLYGERDAYPHGSDEWERINDKIMDFDTGGVPDAPFKTTWPELAMKRIIREAAEKGYDKVAWTPGSVQAERYDLSKHVDRVAYNPENRHLLADKSGQNLIDEKNVSPEKLADYIGKDAAEKLLNSPKQVGSPKIGNYHELTGLDLKVGGEGMKGFYDEILPATVNKLVKKHGARVGQGDMAGVSTDKFDLMGAGSNWRLIDPATGSRVSGSPVFRSGADAEAWVQKNIKKPVHTLDITPQLRAQAMKGFPLFTAGGVAATGIMGEMARQDDYRQ